MNNANTEHITMPNDVTLHTFLLLEPTDLSLDLKLGPLNS